MNTPKKKLPRRRTLKRLVEGAQKFVGDEPTKTPMDQADMDMVRAARRIDELRSKKKDDT